MEGQPFSGSLRRAFEELLTAWDCAAAVGRLPWDFAVNIDLLMSFGLTHTDLRFLFHSGFVEHRVEVSLLNGFSILSANQEQRSFLPPDRLQTVCARSAFCLTDKGIAQIRQLFVEPASASANQDHPPELMLKPTSPCAIVPQWDRLHLQLCYDEKAVKCFRASARNQLLVMEAFHEEGWPNRVDDPLPPAGDVDSKQRLNDTIKSLNRRQLNPLVRFKGDGRGEGICWSCGDRVSEAVPRRISVSNG